MMVADSVIVRPSISMTGSSPDGTFATNSAGLDLQFGRPAAQMRSLLCKG